MNIFHDVVSMAKLLGVSSSTVKKYYLLFEDNNYRFKRTVKGTVTFINDESKLLQRLTVLKNEPGMNLKTAVEQLVHEAGVAPLLQHENVIKHELVMSERDQLFLQLLRETKQELLAIKEVVRSNDERIEELEENIDQRFKRVLKKLKSLNEKESITLINR
ncbi:hypothetical protein [Peribacillus butanolivorans]|uniref:hypothetical protein n=1 Tax=Peribacillus butanolivorans TaxID=421767 RepID=UPI003808CFEC